MFNHKKNLFWDLKQKPQANNTPVLITINHFEIFNNLFTVLIFFNFNTIHLNLLILLWHYIKF